MPYLDQGRDLSLELLSQVVLSCILPIVRKLELFDSNIVLFVSGFIHISAGTGANLFLKGDVSNVDAEIVLTLLELHVENVTRLLRLSSLAGVLAPSSTSTHHVPV